MKYSFEKQLRLRRTALCVVLQRAVNLVLIYLGHLRLVIFEFMRYEDLAFGANLLLCYANMNESDT